MVKLIQKEYSQFEETLYIAKLSSGLQLILLPKKGFRETVAMMSVGFGAMDTDFSYKGKLYHYPSGIAHFLEHKLFEAAQGEDVALQFSQLGADSNAYTSFDRTSYFFSTTGHVEKSLQLLQSFIVERHFTEQSIEREKGIIEQEIAMYQDDADDRLYQLLLAQLFPATPMAQDIAGSSDSIVAISYKDLQKNHDLFYTADNRKLVVVGDFSPKDLAKVIDDTEEMLTIPSTKKIEKIPIAYNPVIAKATVYQDIVSPKVAVGYRGLPLGENQDPLRTKLVLQLLLDMLLGWTSQSYQGFYDTGLIDDRFDIEVECYGNFLFVVITADTYEPIALATKLQQSINQIKDLPDVTEEHFQQVVYECYGAFLSEMDSPYDMAMQLTRFSHYLQIPDMLKNISLEDVLREGLSFFETADRAEIVMLPK